MWDMQDKAVDAICRSCGDKTMTSSSAYMRAARYHNPQKFYLDILDGKGFLYGLVCKQHFRLIAIATAEQYQRSGVASYLLSKLYERCEQDGLMKITFRTHKHGEALKFWQKNGAVIVGQKADDYEMEIVM